MRETGGETATESRNLPPGPPDCRRVRWNNGGSRGANTGGEVGGIAGDRAAVMQDVGRVLE